VSVLGSVSGVRFLDLYAGSGAVGLEACSRGASSAVLVEADRATAGLIRTNAKELGFDMAEVHTGKVERWVDAEATGRGPFDVVYVDPPYSMAAQAVVDVVAGLVESDALDGGGVVVVERSRRDATWEWPKGLQGVREKRYGDTMLFYARAPGSRGLHPGGEPGAAS
jgi:16S rRNA (guanine966-N2)-methyltransferase